MADDKRKIGKFKVLAGFVDFPELQITFTSGTKLVLSGKKGDILPLEVCNETDVVKSLLVGGLKSALEAGWIVEVDEETMEPKTVPVQGKQIDNLKAPEETGEQPARERIVDSTAKIAEIDSLNASSSVKTITLEDTQQIEPRLQEVLLNIDQVNSFDDFIKLTHNLKLEYIKSAKDKKVLELIINRSASKQLKANAKLRLKELEGTNVR